VKPAPTAQVMVAGLQSALADLGLLVTLHETDRGTDLIAVSDVGHPWPEVLASLWWHGIRWKPLPRGMRTCLEEGWCCSAPALEGVIGEHPVPSVERAGAYLRDAIGWHRYWHPVGGSIAPASP
jgi:hypothetical protein